MSNTMPGPMSSDSAITGQAATDPARRPGAGGDDERLSRQRRAAACSEGIPTIGIEAGDIGSGRTDAAGEWCIPPLLERRMLDAHDEGRPLDGHEQPCGLEQLDEVALAHPGETGLIVDCRPSSPAARQKAPSGPPSLAWSQTQAATTPPA